MLLTYKINSQNYKIFIHWTADNGNSTVFQEIVHRISDKHQLNPGDYQTLALHLDSLTDKLYEQIYIFTDEHSGVPYNPRFRRTVLSAFSEISENVKACPISDSLGGENLLAALFVSVADKLRETVEIYLEESANQCKFRERMRGKEEYLETTPQTFVSNEFEDVLLQMTDLSRVMDCLTDIQRGRLVKHIFLKYTLQEIADSEHVSKITIRESVVTSLNKIKKQLD